MVELQGEPRADVQVEVFARPPAGDVEVSLHRTNEAGVAVIPIEAGNEYLVDSVVLLPTDPDSDGDPVWRSLWASLTFRTPDR